MNYADVRRVYDGSDGNWTKALYASLATLGPIGDVAVNVFRAHKTSGRAKDYRGRGYKDLAYGRKEWSLQNLCRILEAHGSALHIGWGWKKDATATDERFAWVLYVTLPTGQVSFHAPARGAGHEFHGEWDRRRGLGDKRICAWVAQLLGGSVPEELDLIGYEWQPPSQRAPAKAQQGGLDL